MDNFAYWQRRLLDEQTAARNARCPEARKCHEMLADSYRRRCLWLVGRPIAAPERDVERIA